MDGAEDLMVALAYGWVWIIVLAAVAAGVARVVRRRKGRNLYKKNDDKQGEV